MDSFKDVSPLHDPFTALKAGASKRRGQETSFAMRSLLFSTYRFSMSSEHAGISTQDACGFLQDGPTFLYANPSVLSVEAETLRRLHFTHPGLGAGQQNGVDIRGGLGVRVRSVYKVSSVGGSREHQKEKETVRDENTGSGKGVVMIDEETDVKRRWVSCGMSRWQIGESLPLDGPGREPVIGIKKALPC
ncbi:hypothetical protein L7F22_057037 [Adiantum nelumboides]|nr:hypothetical protein [Adiantum nelumboides]